MRHLLLAAALLLSTAPVRAETPERIVSLGGAVTEIVAALGAADRLVGRDSTSNWPPEVRDLPNVGYVRALSPEGVLALDPDLILSEDGAGPMEAVEVLRAAGIPFVTLPGEPTPEGVIAKFETVGKALGREAEAAALAADFAAKIAEVKAEAAAVTERKRVLFVLAIQGGRVMAGGENSAASQIIELAGGINAGTGFEGFKPTTDEALLEAAPDVILMMDREGDLAVHAEDVLAHPALAETPAAKDGAILRMDGMLLLGFGPRTAEAAAQLHDALYGAE